MQNQALDDSSYRNIMQWEPPPPQKSPFLIYLIQLSLLSQHTYRLLSSLVFACFHRQSECAELMFVFYSESYPCVGIMTMIINSSVEAGIKMSVLWVMWLTKGSLPVPPNLEIWWWGWNKLLMKISKEHKKNNSKTNTFANETRD